MQFHLGACPHHTARYFHALLVDVDASLAQKLLGQGARNLMKMSADCLIEAEAVKFIAHSERKASGHPGTLACLPLAGIFVGLLCLNNGTVLEQ
jgi:hypothetical protein